MMNNKSPFYFCDRQFYKVMAYIELFLNLNYIEIEMEEWMIVEQALKTISMLPDDSRNADSFYTSLDDSVSFKNAIYDLTKDGKYALFEDNREIVIKDMDEVRLSLFDYYGNFINQ